MSTRANKPYWSKSFRIGTTSIYAWERRERGGIVFLKYSDSQRRGRDKRAKVKLKGDFVVRDARGRLDAKKVRQVEEAVSCFGAQRLLGQPIVRTDSIVPLTLADGFERALDLTTGKYPTPSLRWQEVKRAQRKLERILGANMHWVDIRPSEIRHLWRTLAKEFRDAPKGSRPCGHRQTVVTVDALYSVAAWLREEEQLPLDALLPMRRWRQKLTTEWEELTQSQSAPARPRHTSEEMRKLFRVMHHDEVDPRFALAFDLGGEQRLGQVLRCRRSDVDLPVVDLNNVHKLEAGRLGIVRIPSAGKKRAAPVALTPEQRAAIERALAGYLADLEAARRDGRLSDYPLFPAGRFVGGRAKIHSELRHLTRDAALGMFRELERVAGVAHVAGRGWYGVRRVASDEAEDFENDDRVLNSITGHRDSTTRRLVYQQPERPEILARAAETRDAVRKGKALNRARSTSPDTTSA